jgi:hypothetical protein
MPMSAVGSEALVHLATCALCRGFVAEDYGTDSLLIAIDVPHVDGVRVQYRIVVDVVGPHLLAHEEPATRHLPEFCPERHIIEGGHLCMYWPGEFSFLVTDSESAGRWLDLLLNFLRLQRRVAHSRKWPNHETWAHGRAAIHQQRAERAADELDAELRNALDARQLRASSEATSTFRVLQDDQPLFSVWRSPNRRDQRGHRLACALELGSRKRKVIHGRRAELLEELAFALVQWELDEKRFWMLYKDHECCGTINDCPLRKSLGEKDGTEV